MNIFYKLIHKADLNLIYIQFLINLLLSLEVNHLNKNYELINK